MKLDRKMFHHQVLLKKLELYGINGQTLSFLESYLSNRNQKCQIQGSVSSDHYILTICLNAWIKQNLGCLLTIRT
jgi:hypothetical protein